MAARFTVFISSTVKDFGPVRRDLREWLEARGITVRLSEDPEFHVEPDVHSHEACLRAIEGCHLFILLVGWRWGGNYRGTKQSITWREYDEAVRLRIPTLKFVLRDMNEAAIRAGQRTSSRRSSAGRQPGAKELDTRLLPFLDALRKGHVNNWVHLDWDGSFSHLRRVVDARLNALFTAYQDKHQRLQLEAERRVRYAAARFELDLRVASTLVADIGRGKQARAWFQELFDILVTYRDVLFGFREEELYDFVLYVRRERMLDVAVRRAHPSIKRRDRSWRLGKGHVGLAAETGDPLVSPNLQHTEGWSPQFSTDARNYVSGVFVPLVSGRSAGDLPAGVFLVTSNRPDHFRETVQLEVLTALSVGLMLTKLDACERVL